MNEIADNDRIPLELMSDKQNMYTWLLRSKAWLEYEAKKCCIEKDVDILVQGRSLIYFPTSCIPTDYNFAESTFAGNQGDRERFMVVYSHICRRDEKQRSGPFQQGVQKRIECLIMPSCPSWNGMLYVLS